MKAAGELLVNWTGSPWQVGTEVKVGWGKALTVMVMVVSWMQPWLEVASRVTG